VIQQDQPVSVAWFRALDILLSDCVVASGVIETKHTGSSLRGRLCSLCWPGVIGQQVVLNVGHAPSWGQTVLALLGLRDLGEDGGSCDVFFLE
jgi:hypothetical protein